MEAERQQTNQNGDSNPAAMMRRQNYEPLKIQFGPGKETSTNDFVRKRQ